MMTNRASPDVACSSRPRIAYEAHNLTLRQGTGVATYARSLAYSADRIGYSPEAIVGVERRLSRTEPRLNEVLAFDAVADKEREGPVEAIWRIVGYPFNALTAMRPVEVVRSGLVTGPLTDSLRPFNKVFASRRLVDSAIVHFKIYGRRAAIKLPRVPFVFHATHPAPMFVKGCPNIYTVHDLVPLRLPYTTLDDKKYFFRLLSLLARKADHLVTVSEHSRLDIIKHLKVAEDRVTNTYQAVEIPAHVLEMSEGGVADDIEKFFGLEYRKYFIFCGAIEPKKNVANLIDAYAASGTSHPLVVAGGGGWQNAADLRKLRDERFVSFRMSGDVLRRERQIRQVGFLGQEQLMTLIRGARAMIFPSIYEGFGLPVVEAMMLGTPVITSNAASLPEVAADAALIVDPYSVDDIAMAIRAIDADADLRHELSCRGPVNAQRFSAARYDERMKQLYQRF
jgi:glycosyltransferase involved in cell wall biosynthesis